MKFDIHCHVYADTGFIPKGGTFFLSIEQQLQAFEEQKVDMGLILPLIHYEIVPYVQTNEGVAEIVRQYPDKFLFFMNLDPRMFYKNPKADFSELIEYNLALGAKGVGEMCANLPFDDPLMQNMFYYINKYKLPLTIHISPTPYNVYGIQDDYNLSGLERALDKFPDIKFLGHSADFWCEISGDDKHGGYPTGPVEPNGRVVQLLEQYPNLYGDLSAGSGLNAMTRDAKFAAAFMEKFQDRLLFGEDFCKVADTQGETLSKHLDQMLKDGAISQTVYDKICWDNAAKLLELPLLSEQAL